MTIQLGRGANLGGWISQNKQRGPERRNHIAREDLDRIAGWGFDHVRIPVDEAHLYLEDGSPDAEAWDLLDAGIDWALTDDLNVVVDLHILRSHFFNADERPLFTDPAAPARFAEVWDALSARLTGRPLDRLAYELMNEPVADDPEDWNRVYPAPLAAIRAREPERTVVLGSNCWSQACQFEFLAVPPKDRHLALTFHYYYPMHVTHYRAGFVKKCACYDGPVRYPGMPIAQSDFDVLAPDVQSLVAEWNRHYDPRVMAADLLWPLAVSRRCGLPLYCGEFGCIRQAPAAIRDAWHCDIIGVLEAAGIGWAIWNYPGWGPFDREDRSIDLGFLPNLSA